MWGHLAQSGIWLPEDGPCSFPVELSGLGLSESSKHLWFTGPQAYQEFGAQGTVFLSFDNVLGTSQFGAYWQTPVWPLKTQVR